MTFPKLTTFPSITIFPGLTETSGVDQGIPGFMATLTVEVRDKALNRLGQIRVEDLDLKIVPLFNNVGAWTLKLPSDHPMTEALRTPGAGILITGPANIVISGPVTNPVFETSPDDPEGTATFTGVTDDIILRDYLSIPQPSNPDMTTQNVAHDKRTGTAEDLLHAYVNANMGPGAPSERRKANLIMGPNLHRGPVISKSPRFPILGNLLEEIALSGNLGFRVVQRGSSLVFETYEVVNRTDTVRLDVRNGQLIGQKVTTSPPTATRVLVAGQEEGVERQFVYRDNLTSLAAEAEWGRRIERFLDQRQTNVVAELVQAADEVLAEEGYTATSAQVVPSEDTSLAFGVDWYLGDSVVVVVEDGEYQSTVTGIVIVANSDGFRIGAQIGDVSSFSKEATYSKRVTSLEDRVGQIEKNVEIGIQRLLGNEDPLMDGEVRIGISERLAREDHRHPSDVSKVDRSMFTTSTAPASGTGTAVGHVWIQY